MSFMLSLPSNIYRLPSTVYRLTSVSPRGLEPRTNSLKGYCSTIELRTRILVISHWTQKESISHCIKLVLAMQ